jgi:hypothetical protein
MMANHRLHYYSHLTYSHSLRTNEQHQLLDGCPAAEQQGPVTYVQFICLAPQQQHDGCELTHISLSYSISGGSTAQEASVQVLEPWDPCGGDFPQRCSSFGGSPCADQTWSSVSACCCAISLQQAPNNRRLGLLSQCVSSCWYLSFTTVTHHSNPGDPANTSMPAVGSNASMPALFAHHNTMVYPPATPFCMLLYAQTTVVSNWLGKHITQRRQERKFASPICTSGSTAPYSCLCACRVYADVVPIWLQLHPSGPMVLAVQTRQAKTKHHH